MPFLHIRPCSQILKNISDYSTRFHMNVQLPSCKTHFLHNSFLNKGSILCNFLPTALHNSSSRKFRAKVSNLFLTKRTKVWRLHGCNTNAIAIVCMLYTGHSKLSIDGDYNQICQCGSIETELHIYILNVLPPTHHAKCWFQKLFCLPMKICLPILILLL